MSRYREMREAAQRQLLHASTQRTKSLNYLRTLAQDIARTERNIRRWDRRVRHYMERAQMTDEQLEAARAKRARRKTPRRGIKLGGDV